MSNSNDSIAAGGATDFEGLQDALAYRFHDTRLLRHALTHPSAGEGREPSGHYQRLEFLGDRVLGLIVAGELFERDSEADEGELAVRLNSLVRRETLSEIALEFGLGGYLILGRSEELSGGRERASVLADAFEALLGALYRDGGIEAARGFVLPLLAARLEDVAEVRKDAKTRLQERVQACGALPPTYAVVEEQGPSHDPTFTIEVAIDDGRAARGTGGSKRAAERAAAAAMLAELDDA